MLWPFLLLIICTVSGSAEVRQVLDFDAFTQDKAEITGTATVICSRSEYPRDSSVQSIRLLVHSLPRDSLFTAVGEFDRVKANRALKKMMHDSNNRLYRSDCSLEITSLSLTPELVAALQNRVRAKELLHDQQKDVRVQHESLEQLEQKEETEFLKLSYDNRCRYLTKVENQTNDIENRITVLQKEHFPDSTSAAIIALKTAYTYRIKRLELLRKLLESPAVPTGSDPPHPATRRPQN